MIWNDADVRQTYEALRMGGVSADEAVTEVARLVSRAMATSPKPPSYFVCFDKSAHFWEVCCWSAGNWVRPDGVAPQFSPSLVGPALPATPAREIIQKF